MKTGKVFKECEKKGIYWITETYYEPLCERAMERGLEEITDELVIEEIKYQFEHAPYGCHFAPVFDYDAYEKELYSEEYKEAKKEYNALKRMYKKYCEV